MTECEDPIVRELKKAAPFPVYVECEGYPDVVINLFFEKHRQETIVKKVVDALQAYMISYNKWHFLRPIHYVSDVDSLPDPINGFSFGVHIDFGNANPKALVGAMKAIVETGVPICRALLE